MSLSLRLTLSFVFLFGVAGVTLGAGGNERLDIADFRRDPESFAGRIVEVEARVIAVNALGRNLVLFDSPSHTRISVQLTELPKSQRMLLVNSDVRQVVVRGRATVVEGHLTIHAQSVQPVAE